jgi:hypothetical protein
MSVFRWDSPFQVAAGANEYDEADGGSFDVSQ